MPIQIDLRYPLARRRISIGELARKVGITTSNLSRLKNGHAKAIRFSTLDALCAALDCQPGELIRHVPPMPESVRRLVKGTRVGRVSPRYDRFCLLPAMAYGALGEGKRTEAVRLAHELLETAPDHRDDWNHGNAVFHANVVLGRAALLEGRQEEARLRLLDAGLSPGSPQLDSFGPNMTLAKELLERGERDCVLEFLHRCARFWKPGDDRLARWVRAIQSGKTPDFGANLVYE